MKRLAILFLLILCYFGNIAFADSDYINDHTLIDCLEGDDNLGESFNSEKPYQTIKKGIEDTIDYINTNINITGNEDITSGVLFKVKVNCTANDLLNSQINLNFNGKDYNNELQIEGVGDNGLVIQDTYFYLPNKTGQIVFKNVKFQDNSKFGYYFKQEEGSRKTKYDYDKRYDYFEFYGIKIVDSYIKLFPGTDLSAGNNFEAIQQIVRGNRSNYYVYHDISFSLNSVIEKSVIDVLINNDYNYRMGSIFKDSQLNFSNTGSGTYDIKFVNWLNHGTDLKYSNSIFLSNSIDLGGNNFKTENRTNIAYINNKFKNFKDFDFSGAAVYFNNTFLNNTVIDISNSKNLINNVFKTGYTDTYDVNNLRKNYSLDNIGNKGIFWYYKYSSPLKYFDFNLNSSSLYKMITGREIPVNKNGIHVIYNR